MSRHQFQHGRTLDAIELRGCIIIPAGKIKEGDEVHFLDERYNYTVESVEEKGDTILLRSGEDTTSHLYDPTELLYIKR